jgi:hypothetical protein
VEVRRASPPLTVAMLACADGRVPNSVLRSQENHGKVYQASLA